MIFRDQEETETNNLDQEIWEIETETRVSSNPVQKPKKAKGMKEEEKDREKKLFMAFRGKAKI